MKSYIVLIVLAASVAIASALHAYKTRKPDDLDKLEVSLSDARKILPAGSAISFWGDAAKPELLSWARYAMTPRYLDASGKYDTTLVIRYKQNGDSLLQVFNNSRNIIWQDTDAFYHYSISATR